MFAPLTEPIARLSETFREHAPATVALLRRYVEAREKEAKALTELANAVTLIANVREMNSYSQGDR